MKNTRDFPARIPFASFLGAFGMIVLFLFPSNVQATTYEYAFTFKGKTQRLSLELSDRNIKHYSEKTHFWPTSLGAYARKSVEDPGYEYLGPLVGQLKRQAKAAGYAGWEFVEYAAAFVQNLTYIPEGQEYVRFPIETLKDKGGDCEDTSILLAAILDQMGYEAVLVHLPGHMITAVKCGSNCSGSTIAYKGDKYLMIETTAALPMGHMDKRFANAKATVVTLDQPDTGRDIIAVNPPNKPGQPRATSPRQTLPQASPDQIVITSIDDLRKVPGFSNIIDFDSFRGYQGIVDISDIDAFQGMPGVERIREMQDRQRKQMTAMTERMRPSYGGNRYQPYTQPETRRTNPRPQADNRPPVRPQSRPDMRRPESDDYRIHRPDFGTEEMQPDSQQREEWEDADGYYSTTTTTYRTANGTVTKTVTTYQSGARR